MEENKDKPASSVSVGKILGQFWRGIQAAKWAFFISLILFLANQLITLFVPLYYKKFFDVIGSSANPLNDAPFLLKIVTTVLVLHLIAWLIWRFAVLLINITQPRVMARLKQNSFNYLMRHSHSFFTDNFGGSLVQKVNRFSRAFESLSDTLIFNFLPLAVSVIGSIWIISFIAPTVAVVMGVWVIVVMIASTLFSSWKLKYDELSAESDSKTTSYLADSITNNNAVIFFTGHHHESMGFKQVSDDQAKKIFLSWQLADIMDAVQGILIVLVEFFIFYFAIKYWELGTITIGTFVLAQTYVLNVAYQLWGLSRNIRTTYQNFADSKEMVEILLKPHEVSDLPEAKELEIEKGEIVFRDVSFGFKSQDKILNDLNLTIKPKQKVALVGHSGSGKTTFVRLIMRLYNLNGGQILIDNQDISKVTQTSLREKVSFVPQDPVLFHRTLLENIRYGRREASDEEVREAARLAHCDDFIENLPLKYDTMVGERGIKLSGGERQRVAIARAILKKAPILIFDEATSSLDSYSESLIQDALENLMKDCTTIVIAHRLSTVKKMDRIIVMDKGLVVEDGTHEELINNGSGLYKKLWDLQVGGFL